MVIFRSFGICEMSATNEESVLRIGALRISRDRNVSLLITRSITTSPPPDFDVLRPVTTPPFLAHPIINGRSCSTIPDFKTNVEHQFDSVSHIQTHGPYTVRSATPPNTQKPDGHQTIRLCTAKPHHGRSASHDHAHALTPAAAASRRAEQSPEQAGRAARRSQSTQSRWRHRPSNRSRNIRNCRRTGR